MNWNAPTILCMVAGGLAIISFFKPWPPLLSVAVLLIAVAGVVAWGAK